MHTSDERSEPAGERHPSLVPLVILISLGLDSIITVHYWERIAPDYFWWFWMIFLLTGIPYSGVVRVAKALDHLQTILNRRLEPENESEYLTAVRTLRVETRSFAVTLLL